MSDLIETENYCMDCGESIFLDDGEYTCIHCHSGNFGGPDFDIPPHAIEPMIQLLESIVELDKAAEARKKSQ